MALVDGFYAESDGIYIEPDELSRSRELAISVMMATVNQACPGVLQLESRTPSSQEYGEALQEYARQVGNAGFKQTIQALGSLPTRCLVGSAAIDTANEVLSEEAVLRQTFYQEMYRPVARGTQLLSDFPFTEPQTIGWSIKSRLPEFGSVPTTHTSISASAYSALYNQTLVQLKAEKLHLTAVAHRKPSLLGRWAMGNLV